MCGPGPLALFTPGQICCLFGFFINMFMNERQSEKQVIVRPPRGSSLGSEPALTVTTLHGSDAPQPPTAAWRDRRPSPGGPSPRGPCWASLRPLRIPPQHGACQGPQDGGRAHPSLLGHPSPLVHRPPHGPLEKTGQRDPDARTPGQWDTDRLLRKPPSCSAFVRLRGKGPGTPRAVVGSRGWECAGTPAGGPL